MDEVKARPKSLIYNFPLAKRISHFLISLAKTKLFSKGVSFH